MSIARTINFIFGSYTRLISVPCSTKWPILAYLVLPENRQFCQCICREVINDNSKVMFHGLYIVDNFRCHKYRKIKEHRT